jgi:hypothetical protein
MSKQKFRDGDSKAAKRLAEKSLRLFETSQAKSWVSFLDENSAPSAKSAASERLRKPKSEEKKEEEPTQRPYTSEQVQGIKKILEYKAKGDLYGVFGLEKGCSEVQIKKAYRKVVSN